MVTANRSLVRNRLLAALPQEDFDQIYPELVSVSLSQRQILQETGTAIEQIYFLEGGLASLVTTMIDGTTIEIGMFGIEGMVGVPSLLAPDLSRWTSLVQIPGNALQIATVSFKAAFDRSAAVRAAVLRFADFLMNLGAQTAACNGLHPIAQRFARWLLMASDRSRLEIMPLTHEYLASMLGVRRAGVTAAAGEFQRAGLIRYRRGQITIVDRGGLEAMACECYRVDRDQLARLF